MECNHRRSSDLDNKWIWIIAVIVLVILGVAAIVWVSMNSNGTSAEPELSVNLLTLYGKAGSSLPLNISISNVGGDAKGVSVNLHSDAFGQVSSNPIDVSANQTVYVQCNAQVKDVTSAEYGVTVSCSHSGAAIVNTDNSSQFYVLPSIELTDVHFVMTGGFLGIGAYEKDNIGQNDNTTLLFEIKSDSANWTYTGLSATATLPQSTLSLTITPNPLSIDNIGPQGTSKEYSFAVTSHNTPLGKYTITIHVFSGQYEIAINNTKQVTVS
jgi:hypothetical protein